MSGARPRKPKTGFLKREIEGFLAEGERIVKVYAIVRPSDDLRSTKYTPAFEFEVYLHLTGFRGYYVWFAKGNTPKIFKSFDRMFRTIREIGYHGAVTVYDQADEHRPPPGTGATRRRVGDLKPAEAEES